MSEWISVEDRLPDIGDRVLIFTSHVIEAFRYEDRSFNRFGVDCKPSHWMPLPEPPTGGEL